MSTKPNFSLPNVRNSLGRVFVEDGKYYLNGHGDVRGPMDVRVHLFSDQFGIFYLFNGLQLGHTHDSLGNLVCETELRP